MKKIMTLALVTLTTALILTGCGDSDKSEDGQTGDDGTGLQGSITMMTNTGGETFDAVEDVVNKFMDENPGVTVEYSTQTKDYESLMKAKMAANDLPDVFATHGWSVNRYSEYLLPINDQTFAENISDSLKPIVSDEEGNMFVLPINLDQGGIVYNKDILAELGMEIPKTVDDFLEVCEAAKNAEYIPIYIAGKDDRQPANLLDIMATSWLISDSKNDYSESLADGSFDFANWDPIAEFLLTLSKNEYFNVDSVTADPITMPEKMAENNVLFTFQNNSMITSVAEFDESVNLGMMPVPVVYEGDEHYLYGGEREAYGVWKDSENKEISLALLNFMAQPENIQYICEASGMPSAINGVEVELGSVTEDYEAYKNLRILPYFDRVHLPNGMWGVLRTTGGALLASDATASEASAIMEENYNKLRNQSN